MVKTQYKYAITRYVYARAGNDGLLEYSNVKKCCKSCIYKDENMRTLYALLDEATQKDPRLRL